VAVKSANTVQDLTKLNASKEAARQCLLAADKFLKESQFELARQQLEKAKELDPSNIYIFAFQDRIAHFEEKRKKEGASKPPPSPPVKNPRQPVAASPTVSESAPPKIQPKPQPAPVPPPERPKGGDDNAASERKIEAEVAAIMEQRRREEEARVAAQEQKRREVEARLAAEEQRRRELSARLAAEDEARREAEARVMEELRRRDLETRALAEERLRRELEERVVEEERKRKELEERVARKELEAKAAAEEQRRKELEARIAAEEQRRKELEARLAAEEQRRKEEQARTEEERRRKDLEERVAEEERKRKDLESRAAAEEGRRKDLEARAAEEQKRRRELEAQVAAESQRRKELEAQLIAEEGRRREEEKRIDQERNRQESLRRATDEERRRKDLEAWAAEEKKRRVQGVQGPAQAPEPGGVPVQAREEQQAQGEAEQQKIVEMRRQIEDLTKALDQEKKAREEISKMNLQNAVKQLRAALEPAWVNGAPVEKAAEMLHEFALSLSIPPEVEQSVIREVKLEMYSRAVKEVIAKRKLLRSSSSTLEWLRKVYQVSVAEYLEYESKFLLDLVADQYKGTILLVSRSIGTKEDITPRLKSAGYVVVQASTPESALEKIEKVNPNLILCDTEFSDSLSGIRFLHIMRANSKFSFIPFILIGEPAEVNQLNSSELKPNEGVIRRPVNYDELTALMNEKLTYFREYVSALS